MKKISIKLICSGIAIAILCMTTTISSEPKEKSKKGGLYQAYIKPHEAGYGSAGCGIGSIIFGKSEGMEQVIAATTNGTSGNQTFGITSGTSNCQEPSGKNKALYRQREQEAFVSVNYRYLEQEMAAGQGERLNAFANLLGCSAKADFASFARAKHNVLFAPASQKNKKEMQATAFVRVVKSALREQLKLAASCSYI